MRLNGELVRYLFIHELCHTVHLNHAHRFWALVGIKEPDYRALDKRMRHAMRVVPGWVSFGSTANCPLGNSYAVDILAEYRAGKSYRVRKFLNMHRVTLTEWTNF